MIISEGKGRNFILDLYFQWRPAVSACHPFPKYLLSSKDGSQKLTSHIHILIYSGESIISMCEYVCLQKGKSPLRGYFSKIYLFNCFILSILDNLKIFAALLGCIWCIINYLFLMFTIWWLLTCMCDINIYLFTVGIGSSK